MIQTLILVMITIKQGLIKYILRIYKIGEVNHIWILETLKSVLNICSHPPFMIN